VRTIEHGNLIDEETCHLFLEHDAWLVPTLATFHALAREGVEAGMPEPLQRKVYEVLEAGGRMLEMANRTGVPMVYGTDLLGSMHQHQLTEFAIRAESVSNADIIRSATCNAAQAFQRDGEFGVVEPGARADLLAIDGNPLEDIGVMQQPESKLNLIMKAGQVFKNTL
jgi:imidazolonepropionase-like amidohydrolase